MVVGTVVVALARNGCPVSSTSLAPLNDSHATLCHVWRCSRIPSSTAGAEEVHLDAATCLAGGGLRKDQAKYHNLGDQQVSCRCCPECWSVRQQLRTVPYSHSQASNS
jgi:hypothetical protein